MKRGTLPHRLFIWGSIRENDLTWSRRPQTAFFFPKILKKYWLRFLDGPPNLKFKPTRAITTKEFYGILSFGKEKIPKSEWCNLFSTSRVTHLEELSQLLQLSGVPITTFLWSQNDGLSDVARGTKQKIFWGKGMIQEKVGGVRIQVPPFHLCRPIPMPQNR